MEVTDKDLFFAKVRPTAQIPTKESENAGYDIYADFEEDYFIIPAHGTKLVPTGIASAMSEKWYLQVAERGSTGSKGMKYGAGVIDSGYRNEIFICINNVNEVPIIITKLDDEGLKKAIKNCSDAAVITDFAKAIKYPYTKAVAQLILHEVPVLDVKEIPYDELVKIPSKRGLGHLGSSGK